MTILDPMPLDQWFQKYFHSNLGILQPTAPNHQELWSHPAKHPNGWNRFFESSTPAAEHSRRFDPYHFPHQYGGYQKMFTATDSDFV